jgi:hypothetical protein
MKNFLAVLVFSSLLALVALPQPVSACSCAMPRSPTEALDRASAVFRGRVATLEPPARLEVIYTARFTVDTVWKGPITPDMTVNTIYVEAVCGYPFVVGQDYLVYADEESGQLVVTLCSGTRPTNEAQADLTTLGPGSPVNTDPGTGSR